MIDVGILSRHSLSQDSDYIKSSDITMKVGYYAGAIRVEQGEYAVVDIERSIGTYNLNQCIALYASTKQRHGLAHIDGHSHVTSLYAFLNLMIEGIEGEKNQVEIILFGGQGDPSGLNYPELNLSKVRLCIARLIETKKVQFYVSNPDDPTNNMLVQNAFVDITISKESSHRYKYKDIVLERQKNVLKVYLGLPGGFLSKERALHLKQELIRKGGYSGTYDIVPAFIGEDKTVLLDIDVLLKLNQGADAIRRLKDPRDDSITIEFDYGIEYLIEQRNIAVNKLIELMMSMVPITEDKEEFRKNLFEIFTEKVTPIYIGEGSEDKNKRIAEYLYNGLTTNTASLELLEHIKSKITERNNALAKNRLNTIKHAIEELAKIDPIFEDPAEKEVLLQNILKIYNMGNSDKQIVPEALKEIESKIYCAEITERQFAEGLKQTDSLLGQLYVVNTYDDMTTLSDAAQAIAKILVSYSEEVGRKEVPQEYLRQQIHQLNSCTLLPGSLTMLEYNEVLTKNKVIEKIRSILVTYVQDCFQINFTEQENEEMYKFLDLLEGNNLGEEIDLMLNKMSAFIMRKILSEENLFPRKTLKVL